MLLKAHDFRRLTSPSYRYENLLITSSGKGSAPRWSLPQSRFSEADSVCFSVGRVFNIPRLILAFALAITLLALTGCGSRTSPSMQASPAGLPAAIPAAEPVLLFNG